MFRPGIILAAEDKTHKGNAATGFMVYGRVRPWLVCRLMRGLLRKHWPFLRGPCHTSFTFGAKGDPTAQNWLPKPSTQNP